MKLLSYFKGDSLKVLLIHAGTAIGIILLIFIGYFYIYLPAITNHGEEIEVPDLTELHLSQLDSVLTPLKLRYEVGDSSYSEAHAPLVVLRQFPRPHHRVKENRKIYLSINQTSPPTVPMPNLFGDGAGSLINAEAVLKSSELKRGRILYRHSPYRDVLIDVLVNGKPLRPGTRIPKGSVIDLVVGDGAGPRDFVINNFVGLTYNNVLQRLRILSLNLGTVQIPEGVDTTDVENFVLKQFPAAGDSVSIGDPVDLWIGPKGTQIKDEDEEQEDDEKNP